MQTRRPAKITNATARNPMELISHLQRLSREAAEGKVAQVLDSVTGLPVECLGMESSMLLDTSPNGGPCTSVASRHLRRSLPDTCRFPDSCIVKKAALSQTPVFVERISASPSVCTALISQEDTACMVCIPVPPTSHSQAVLVCTRPRELPFKVWEIELLNTIANHAAIVLNKQDTGYSVPLNAGSIERLNNITASGRQLRQNLDDLLPEILSLFGADTGSVMLCEDAGHRVVCSIGLPIGVEHEWRTARDGSVSGRAITTRQPVLLQGAVSGREFHGAIPRTDVSSAIVAPLVHKRKVLGVLNINRARPDDPFTEHDLALAGSIAQFMGLAADNDRLYETVRMQTRHFGDLYRVAKSVTSNLQLQSVLRIIVKRFRKLVTCDVCALFLYDQHSENPRLVSAHGATHDDRDYERLVLPLMDKHSHSGRVLSLPDLTATPGGADPDLIQRLGLQSAVLTPLAINRRSTGFIAAFSRKPGSFARQDIGLALGLSELAAIAIENAGLYQKQKDIANVTQRELTPVLPSTIPGFQVGCKHAPAYSVGGDYYDLIRLDDRRYGLAIIDVAGKDITAFVHVAMCKYALRALAGCSASPARLMQEMNKSIYEHTEPDAFISMIYAIIDTDIGKVTYSCAGHEPALLIKAQSGSVRQLRTPGILLGVKSDATFVDRQSSIEVGDVLLVYTDGLVDSLYPEDPDPARALGKMLAEMSLSHPQEIADNMYEAAVHARSSRSPDDIAVVAIKRAKKVLHCGKH